LWYEQSKEPTSVSVAYRSSNAAIESALHNLQNRYCDLLDPTVNHEHISKVLHIISKPLDQGPLQESWELDGMYVSPSWQRRGVGKMLLQWGLTQATEECVSIVCKSSSVGVLFYEHAGFRSIEEQVFDPYFDPGYKGYHSMIWDPEQKDRNEVDDIGDRST
jgi:GNAT superfamily N-acetyltransferase